MGALCQWTERGRDGSRAALGIVCSQTELRNKLWRLGQEWYFPADVRWWACDCHLSLWAEEEDHHSCLWKALTSSQGQKARRSFAMAYHSSMSRPKRNKECKICPKLPRRQEIHTESRWPRLWLTHLSTGLWFRRHRQAQRSNERQRSDCFQRFQNDMEQMGIRRTIIWFPWLLKINWLQI